MYVGAEQPRDHVLIDGDPPVDATIAGGVNGDAATAAVLVNSLPRVLAAPPGLLTASELPLVHALDPHALSAAPARRR
jgi:4-hydroxy-tetrahydrodipicolinate reductase